MAGFPYLNRKKDISKKLLHRLYTWSEFETDNVEFSIIGDDGWMLLYGIPIALFKRATRNRVHSINLEALTTCSKSRFFMQERLLVPIMKDKQGLFLRIPSKEPTDTIIRLPGMLRWVFLGDLARELFSIYDKEASRGVGVQLPLALPLKSSGVFYDPTDDWVAEFKSVTGATARSQLREAWNYQSVTTAATTAATGAASAVTATEVAERYLRQRDILNMRDILDINYVNPRAREFYLRPPTPVNPRFFNPAPLLNTDPITDGDIPY